MFLDYALVLQVEFPLLSFLLLYYFCFDHMFLFLFLFSLKQLLLASLSIRAL